VLSSGLAAASLVACTLLYPTGKLAEEGTTDASDVDADADNAAPKLPCNYDWTDFNAPQTGEAYDLALTDLDEDGRLDLVLAHNEFFDADRSGGAKVMLGRPGGTFEAWHEESTQTVSAFAVAVADFNGDGRPDVAVALDDPVTDGAGMVDIELAATTGTIGDQWTRIYVPHPRALGTGDLNGDTKTDLVVLSDRSTGIADQRVVVYLGKGGVDFADPVEYDKTLIGHNDIAALAVGDLTQDGLADVVVSNWGSHALTVLVAAKTGGLDSAKSIPDVCEVPWGVAIGDFDADHVPDLAVTCGTDNGFMPLIGEGGGLFKNGTVYAIVSDPAAIAVADLDGDGRDDVLASGDGQVGFRLASSNGASFGEPHVESRGSISHQAGIAIGDIDKDGVKDVIVAGWSALFPVVFRGVCK
jgi:hypothetical protein